MNEKIAGAFVDELKKVGIWPAVAAAARVAAPAIIGAIPSLVGGAKKPKPPVPMTGGLK